MALKLPFGSGCDYQIRHLGREKTAQPAHALDLADLVGDALFELFVEFGYFLRAQLQLIRSLAQFIQKPGVLDRDHGLGGKIRDELNLIVGKWAYLLAIDSNRANQFTLLEHWHVEKASRAAEFGRCDTKRFALGVSLLGFCIDDMHSLLSRGDAAEASTWTGADRPLVQILVVLGRRAKSGNGGKRTVIEAE